MMHPMQRLALAAFATVVLMPTLSVAQTAPINEDLLATFRPRSIGPAVTSGRLHDVEALPNDPSTIFLASASGGLWKTTNRGHTWRNVFADKDVSTFGDVAIAPSNPRIMYAGTGEQNNRQSSSWGNGVYRSDDGGETWRHQGLVETRHIGKVLVHPNDPDIAYVAALGNLWRGNEERGVYRTRDGGQTWQRVHHVDEYTGAVDLVITGTDRTLRSGDVCNKVGTYLKALAAWDCDVPFYVAVPSPSIDWQLDDAASIPIEERSADELTQLAGLGIKFHGQSS